MKNLIFLSLLFPLCLTGQNFIFEIVPTAGQFRVLITDDSQEAYPRPVTDYGLLDSTAVQQLAYTIIEQANNRFASLQSQTFFSQLKADQAQAAFAARVPLNYAEWIASRVNYDGQYQYVVRGTATNFPVTITGTSLTRNSNGNQLATITPRSHNWMRLTSGQTVVDLYQFGAVWVGRNNGNIVTLRRL
jgi:hypothetical protein